MRKFTLTLSFLILSTIISFGQTYLISSGGTVSTCSGTFFDSGGSGSTYLDNENYTMTFVSSNETPVTVAFSAFSLEDSYDYLYIYDEPDTYSPLIGSYTGANSPGTITSSGTSLTFSFTSDGSVNYDGWVATISCGTTVAPTT